MNQVIKKSVETWEQAIVASERKFTEIASASGNLVAYQREAMFAFQMIGKKSDLQKCQPASIKNAIINVASVGLSLNPATALAYLVPRKDEACLDISYRGLLKIATDSGSVKYAKPEIVRSLDLFEYNGPFSAPTHKFNPFAKEDERGQVIGVYCIAVLHDGVMVETMSMEEVNKVKASSKAGSNGPWVSWPEEMIKKTIIKRAYKMWPRTERLATAISVLNAHEGLDLPDEQAHIAMPRAIAETPPIDGEITQTAPSVEPQDLPIVASEVPAKDGPKKLIRAKLLQAEITEAELCAHLKITSFDELMMSHVNPTFEWIANPNG